MLTPAAGPAIAACCAAPTAGCWWRSTEHRSGCTSGSMSCPASAVSTPRRSGGCSPGSTRWSCPSTSRWPTGTSLRSAPSAGTTWSPGSGAPFAADLDALVPEIVAVEALLEPVRATQLCHLDLWADNVLGTPGGGLVVLDWEHSGPGSPSHELGVVLLDFERWLVSTTDEERARNEQWVREYVDEAVTRATVDAILEAVSPPRRP